MKRANGTGTIVHRKDKKRRLPFSVYMDGGHDPDTFRRKRIFLGSFATHREAQEYLEKYRHGLVKKKGKTVTVRDIWDLYREDKKALTGRFSANYDSDWKLYIAPRLANMDITAVKAMHMQNVINTCQSDAVRKAIKSIFKGIFTYAISNDLADKDYSQALKVQTEEKSTMHKPFTTEEMRWLWKNADKEPFMLFLIQTYIGARKTELATILLKDVHLAERYMIGGEKTAAGKNRTIPIAKCILPFVRHFYTISKLVGHDFLVMPDRARGLYQVKGVINMDVLYRKHFPGHSTHDARHTFVTMADNYGISETMVKKIVGHKRNNVTADVYNHKSLTQLLNAVDSLPYGTEMFADPAEKKDSVKTG